jgi:chromosome segregation ATPase
MDGVDSNLIERLTAAKAKVADASDYRIRIEERQNSFREELESYKAQLAEQGIDPSKLDDSIAEAEAELETKLTALETALNATAETPQS